MEEKLQADAFFGPDDVPQEKKKTYVDHVLNIVMPIVGLIIVILMYWFLWNAFWFCLNLFMMPIHNAADLLNTTTAALIFLCIVIAIVLAVISKKMMGFLLALFLMYCTMVVIAIFQWLS